MDFDAIIVGAGPYGLSGATYLKNRGLGVAVFGDPLSFWQDHMPAGMFLRSNWMASHISHPRHKFTLDHFKADTGKEFEAPIPLETFVEYGRWFQQNAVPDTHRRQVTAIEKDGSGFKVTLDDGQTAKSDRVIVATGIAPFPYVPSEFEGLTKSHVSHSSDHTDLSVFHGQQVLIVGGGQSGLDAARILSAYDAQPEVVAKQPRLYWVGQHKWLHRLGFVSWILYSKFDVGPAGISRLVGFPNIFRQLPRKMQNRISYRAIRPAGTGWQRPYLSKVAITVGCRVTFAEILGDKVHVKLSNGTDRLVDHVIIATGYRVDCRRYQFFSPAIRQSLKTAQGYPVLARGLESSVRGLHFVGKPAARSFGPLLNFISGAHFAGPELLRVF
jgi:lysine/ornithine N-monooxygenase